MSDMGDSVLDSEDEVDEECIVCKQTTMRKCAICKDALICSMNCQQIAVLDDDDSDHSAECTIDGTADILYMDVLNNRIPKDKQTIHDFGFGRLFETTQRRKLLEIYATIIRKADVTPCEMGIWVEEKKLFERIAMLVYTFPKLMSLEDIIWLKGTDLWTYGLCKTTQAVFQDIILNQERLQHQISRM